MNIATVRAAMAAALDTGVPGVQVNAYALSSPTPPGLQILPPGVEYDGAMQRGLDQWRFVVQAFAPFGSDIGGQKLLDKLCSTGAGSVKAALELDRTLGGAVQDLWVRGQTPGRMVERGDITMLLVEFDVQVYGK